MSPEERLRLALCDALEPFADGEPFDEQELVDEIIMPIIQAHKEATMKIETTYVIADSKFTARDIERAGEEGYRLTGVRVPGPYGDRLVLQREATT